MCSMRGRLRADTLAWLDFHLDRVARHSHVVLADAFLRRWRRDLA